MLEEESVIKGVIGGGKAKDKKLFVRGDRTKCHHFNRVSILKEYQRRRSGLIKFPSIKICFEKAKFP